MRTMTAGLPKTLKRLKTILIVDDEEPLRSLMVETIKDGSRYRILEARDGMEALAIVEKERPDLVLLDMIMPGMSGQEVCRQIKSKPATSGVIVVMVSAMAGESDSRAALDAGADVYITKPFGPVALAKRIDELLGTR